MLKTRIMSAIIGIPILLAILYKGGYFWTAFFVLLGLTALFEYYQMMGCNNHKPLFLPGYFILLLLLLSMYHSYLLPGILLGFIVIVILFVLFYPRITVIDLALTLFGPAYIGICLSYCLKITTLSQPLLIILLAFFLTWGSDVGGYIFGSIWGKHKMTPRLSPNKSWEGAAGAVVLCIGLAILFFELTEFAKPNLAYVLLLGLISSILAQFGDLFISGMKRYSGVKDTGRIIPGHGGVLDRFDAFLLVVPLVYYFFLYLA